MWFQRMALEDWFDTYQYDIDFDIGESAVKCLTLGDIDIDPKDILLRYGHHKGRPESQGSRRRAIRRIQSRATSSSHPGPAKPIFVSFPPS